MEHILGTFRSQLKSQRNHRPRDKPLLTLFAECYLLSLEVSARTQPFYIRIFLDAAEEKRKSLQGTCLSWHAIARSQERFLCFNWATFYSKPARRNILVSLPLPSENVVLWDGSDFLICGRNSIVWPFKWKLLSCSFLWYSLLCCTRWF